MILCGSCQQAIQPVATVQRGVAWLHMESGTFECPPKKLEAQNKPDTQ